MQKTKLGISVGLLGAAIYVAAYFGGYTSLILLGGYILLFEENEWLKKAVVKAFALSAIISIAIGLIDVLPSVISMFTQFLGIFKLNISFSWLTTPFNILESIVYLVEKLLFIALGVKALNQGTIKVGVVDKMIDKYMA